MVPESGANGAPKDSHRRVPWEGQGTGTRELRGTCLRARRAGGLRTPALRYLVRWGRGWGGQGRRTPVRTGFSCVLKRGMEEAGEGRADGRVKG